MGAIGHRPEEGVYIYIYLRMLATYHSLLRRGLRHQDLIRSSTRVNSNLVRDHTPDPLCCTERSEARCVSPAEARALAAITMTGRPQQQNQGGECFAARSYCRVELDGACSSGQSMFREGPHTAPAEGAPDKSPPRRPPQETSTGGRGGGKPRQILSVVHRVVRYVPSRSVIAARVRPERVAARAQAHLQSAHGGGCAFGASARGQDGPEAKRDAGPGAAAQQQAPEARGARIPRATTGSTRPEWKAIGQPSRRRFLARCRRQQPSDTRSQTGSYVPT